MNDIQNTTQEVNQTVNQEVNQNSIVTEELTEAAKKIKERKEKKKAAMERRQQAAMRKYIRRITKEHRRAQKRLTFELNMLKAKIGKKDFEMLRDLCMVQVPEQKNEKGEITQQASSYLNKQALLTEARNLLVLKREDRIKNRTRKKTTGRSSKRIAHRAMINFLTKRNEMAIKEDENK